MLDHPGEPQDRRQRAPRSRRWPWLAGGLGALLAALWLGLSLADRDDLLAGQVLGDETLVLALDMAASEQMLHTRSGRLALLSTYRAMGGEMCRAFIRVRDENETLAIACRDTSGQWTVAFAAQGSADPQNPQDAMGHRKRIDAATAFLRDVLRASELIPEEEQALIDRGWVR